MKPIGWNNPSSCCCDRTAPVVKPDVSHSKWKGPDLEGKVSVGVEVTVLFSTSKACCLAAPHNQSFDLWVSAWRGWVSRPASCSRELQYGPCSVGREGHELEFVIKGASSTCWLAHQSLWPTDYWRWCQSQVGAQVGDGRIQCIQCRGFRVRMEMDYRVL